MTGHEKSILQELEEAAVGRGLEFKLNGPYADPLPEGGLWTAASVLLRGVNGSVEVISTSMDNPADNAAIKFPEYLVTIVYNPSSLDQSFVDVKIRPDGTFDTNNPDIFLKGNYKRAFSALLDMMEGKEG
jgi:hypothetical protein